jgi:hypothetical protein
MKNNQSRTVAEDNINQRRPNKRQKIVEKLC